jgi:endonuclease YncB( thermonuclease family)
MVRQGHAIAYLRDSRIYLPEQQAARQARRGLWAGNFQTPADWRREFPRR